MNILLAGGEKTGNILKAFEEKFALSGMTFRQSCKIEDIEEQYIRGEIFDRVLIIEQAINHDNASSDEYSMRRRINDFAESEALKNLQNTSYVFLVTNREIASLVAEEILSIMKDSVIVIKEPRYKLNFFSQLIRNDLNQLRKSADLEVYEEAKTSAMDSGSFEDDVDTIPDYETEELDDAEALFSDNSERYNPVSRIDSEDNFSLGAQDDMDEEISVEGMDTDNGEDIDALLNSMEQSRGSIDFDVTDLSKREVAHIEGDDLYEDMPTDSIDVDEMTSMIEADGLYDNDEDQSNIGVSSELGEDLYSTPDINVETQMVLDDDGDDSPPSRTPMREPKKFGRGKNEGASQSPKTSHKVNTNDVRSVLETFSNRGTSIMFTGCGGSGNSVVVFNVANTLAQLGYTTLIVDMDARYRAQAYISEASYQSVEIDGKPLISALTSGRGLEDVSIVKPLLHLLTMGMGGDPIDLAKFMEIQKVLRFSNFVKNNYQFIIYDMPFHFGTTDAKELVAMMDNIVLTVPCNNWGISKTLIEMCNVEDDDTRSFLFDRGQLLFNRYNNLKNLFGRRVKTTKDITKVMDSKVQELAGEDIEMYFQEMHVCGVIKEDSKFEDFWFNDKQVSDSDAGRNLFCELIMSILLKK